jgi:hypothetical protein
VTDTDMAQLWVAGRSARPRRNYLDGFEQQPLIVRRAYLVSSEDAFRAGGYEPIVAHRDVAKTKMV